MRKHDKCPYDSLDADEMHQEIARQAETLISTIETLVHLHSHHLELSEPHWSLEKCRFAAHRTVATNLTEIVKNYYAKAAASLTLTQSNNPQNNPKKKQLSTIPNTTKTPISKSAKPPRTRS